MTYLKLDITNSSFDEEFINFLNFHQNEFVSKVLLEALDTVKEEVIKDKNVNEPSEKQALKTKILDFFLSPKYDNAFDAISFRKKTK